MRFIKIGGVPVAEIDQLSREGIVLLEEGAGIGIADPAIESACKFAEEEFDAIGFSFGGEDIGFDVVVEQELGAAFVIEIIMDPFVVDFYGGFDGIGIEVMVEAE